MLVLLLSTVLFQADSVYSTPALRDLVARAAAGNHAAPAELARYRARVESEAAMVLLTAEGEEITAQVEQVASHLEWRRDGAYAQRIVGHRVQAIGPNVSALTYLRNGWLVPSLYGEWLRIILPRDSADARKRRGPVYEAVHPLAGRRDSIYRFDGGDTVAVVHLPERTLRVVRVHVTPRRAPDRSVLLFEGDLDLDADRHQIVRIRGRLVAVRPDRGLAARILSLAVSGVAFLELENGEREGRYWLPYRQRIEFQALSPLTDARAILRIASQFHDYTVDESLTAEAPDGAVPPLAHPPLPTPAPDSAPGRAPPRVTFAPTDSLSRYDGWTAAPGALTAAMSARDFDDVAPPALRDAGPPHLRFGVRRSSDLVRYNRVEGLYTGGGAVLSFRDAAPGLTLRGWGGWAWSEAAARGELETSFQRGGWEFSTRGGRELAHTNDFTPPFERNPGIQLLFGAPDDFDYLDRRALLVSATRALRAGGESRIRLEGGWNDERALSRRLLRPPIGRDTLRLNRPIVPGRYALSRLVLEHGRSATAFSLRPGLGATLLLERATGELAWEKIEGAAQYRHTRGPFTLAARLDAGLVAGATPPLQVLYELGGGSTLPGYDYKAFAGDRAALLRGAVRYRLGVLEAPLRLGALVLPAIAPAPSIRWQGAWTAAHGGNTASAIDRLGSRETGGIRSTIDLHFTTFGGMFGIGVARPLDHGARWKLVWSVGSSL